VDLEGLKGMMMGCSSLLVVVVAADVIEVEVEVERGNGLGLAIEDVEERVHEVGRKKMDPHKSRDWRKNGNENGIDADSLVSHVVVKADPKSSAVVPVERRFVVVPVPLRHSSGTAE